MDYDSITKADILDCALEMIEGTRPMRFSDLWHLSVACPDQDEELDTIDALREEDTDGVDQERLVRSVINILS